LFDLAARVGVIGHPVELDVDKKGNPKLDDKGNQVFKEKTSYWCFPADSSDPTSIQWYGKPKVIQALGDAELYDKVFEACMNTNKKNITDDNTDMLSLLGSSKEEEAKEEEVVKAKKKK
jgi:hypothetical protein